LQMDFSPMMVMWQPKSQLWFFTQPRLAFFSKFVTE
jgi:hypothetical protein